MKYRYGRHPLVKDYRTLKFQDYAADLPPPPPACDQIKRVCTNTGMTPQVLFPIAGNDQYGDCVMAAFSHLLAMWTGMTGPHAVIEPTARVLKWYFSLTHGLDTGLNMLTALKYWRKHTMAEKILGFVSINPHNHVHVQQAIEIFGSVDIGFQVQQDAQQEFEARTPWVPGPLLNEGHSVVMGAYDQGGGTALTWGDTQLWTWDWWDECVDEAYAILPREAMQPGFAPGFDFKQLQADLNLVAS
jgi:hypothetical protein